MVKVPGNKSRGASFRKGTLMKDFEDVAVEMEPMIYSIIRKLHIYKNQAEYYQTGLVGLWHAYRTFDKEKGTFPTYAYYCIRGAILDELKKDMKKEEREQLPSDYQWQVIANQTLDSDATAEHSLLVEELLQHLPEKQRQLVELHFIQGMKLKEAANQLKIGYTTAKTWKRNALDLLKSKWEQE